MKISKYTKISKSNDGTLTLTNVITGKTTQIEKAGDCNEIIKLSESSMEPNKIKLPAEMIKKLQNDGHIVSITEEEEDLLFKQSKEKQIDKENRKKRIIIMEWSVIKEENKTYIEDILKKLSYEELYEIYMTNYNEKSGYYDTFSKKAREYGISTFIYNKEITDNEKIKLTVENGIITKF